MVGRIRTLDVLYTFQSELCVNIDCMGILSILYRSGFDLKLGLSANFMVVEVNWYQLDMEEKWRRYE